MILLYPIYTITLLLHILVWLFLNLAAGFRSVARLLIPVGCLIPRVLLLLFTGCVEVFLLLFLFTYNFYLWVFRILQFYLSFSNIFLILLYSIFIFVYLHTYAHNYAHEYAYIQGGSFIFSDLGLYFTLL